ESSSSGVSSRSTGIAGGPYAAGGRELKRLVLGARASRRAPGRALDALAHERHADRAERLAQQARGELVGLADQPLALGVEPAADDEQRRPGARAPVDDAGQAP